MARILVVDDEADMRLALSNVLIRTGHQVVEAPEGESALALLAKEPMDLVLLDMRLPGMDGIQILRRIRETDKDLPVIMVTGYGSVDSAIEVMRLGASHYLSKPFSNRELVETVERVLEGKGAPLPAVAHERGLSRGGVLTAPARSVPVSPYRDRPASREYLWIGLTLAALALLAWPLKRGLSSRGGDYQVPYSHPAAAAWSGDRLWTADWFTQTVHEQVLEGGSLRTVRSVALPHTHITGLAVTKDALYLSDSWKRTLQKRRLDGALSLVSSVKSPGPNPSGLFWDGRYLWSSDAAQRRFYQHDTDDGLTVVANYKSPGKAPAGMHKDDRYFWSADADSRLIYKHRLDPQLQVIASYHLPLLDEGGEPLSCFARRGESLWLGRDGRPTLHERRLSDFRELPARN